MEAARRFKANLKLDGKLCGWCQSMLKLGEDAAICTTCENAHHDACWETKAGCSTAACMNAPLIRLDSTVAGASAAVSQPQELSPGMMACPGCRAPVLMGTYICPTCRAITSPDGIYHGPKITAPGAAAALTYGIIGLFVCGMVLGPMAINKANAAKQAIASDPTLGGDGLATAGKVMGVLDLIVWVIYVLVKVGGK